MLVNSLSIMIILLVLVIFFLLWSFKTERDLADIYREMIKLQEKQISTLEGLLNSEKRICQYTHQTSIEEKRFLNQITEYGIFLSNL